MTQIVHGWYTEYSDWYDISIVPLALDDPARHRWGYFMREATWTYPYNSPSELLASDEVIKALTPTSAEKYKDIRKNIQGDNFRAKVYVRSDNGRESFSGYHIIPISPALLKIWKHWESIYEEDLRKKAEAEDAKGSGVIKFKREDPESNETITTVAFCSGFASSREIIRKYQDQGWHLMYYKYGLPANRT